jgi:hypothetical protein
MAMSQMADQPTKGGRSMRIIQLSSGSIVSSAFIFMGHPVWVVLGFAISHGHRQPSSEREKSVHANSIRGRKVKILATLGPASRDPEMIRKLIRAGPTPSAST